MTLGQNWNYMQNIKRTNVVAQCLKSQVRDFWIDIAEIPLDGVLELALKDSDFLREIPGLKAILASIDLYSAIQSASFLKKYAHFIGQISVEKLTEEDAKNLDVVLSSPKDIDKIIENTIIYIDRYHNELKAKLLGKLFVETFKHNRFSVKEYNSLMSSIEQVHPVEGWDCLKEFYEYDERLAKSSSEQETQDIWAEGAKIDFQPLLMSGLLRLPSGGSYSGDLGGAFINKKGIKFYEYIIKGVLE